MSIEQELDEERYNETTILHKRHMSDAILRTPLSHINPPYAQVVHPDATVLEVIETMKEHRQNAVLIKDENSKVLLGIFTERDLLQRVAGFGWNYREHKVSEVMTPDPECLQPKNTIGYALNRMMKHGYRHIPIKDPSGGACQMVSVRDLLLYLSEHFPENVLNLPQDPQIPTDRDGG